MFTRPEFPALRVALLVAVAGCMNFTLCRAASDFLNDVPRTSEAAGMTVLLERMSSLRRWKADATVVVQFPQGDDVVYHLSLAQSAQTDSLAPANYLIGWEIEGHEDDSRGFACYFDRNFYRHNGGRLQEYHYDWDSIPFIVGGSRGGVQRTAQFASLMPAFMAEELREIAADPRWELKFNPDTLSSGSHVAMLEATMRVDGCVGKHVVHTFSPEVFTPISSLVENNPAGISEQILVISYSEPAADAADVPIAEADLIALYPEVFETMRESNFSVESLRGRPMPEFALPTATGERYVHQKGDAMRAPTVIAVIDPEAETAAATVGAIREAFALLPFAADAVYAFNSTNVDLIESVVPEIFPGEHLLTTARPLVRDCGIAALPTLIFVGRDGRVGSVVIGFNKNLRSDVIENITQ